MRTYAINCRPRLLVLDLICAVRRRSRRDGGGDDDDESMDMTSDSSGGRWSERGWEGGTLSDGEGRNKGVFGECRGEEHDDEERLVVSKGGSTGPYHTIRMHTRRRKGGRHGRMTHLSRLCPRLGLIGRIMRERVKMIGSRISSWPCLAGVWMRDGRGSMFHYVFTPCRT